MQVEVNKNLNIDRKIGKGKKKELVYYYEFLNFRVKMCMYYFQLFIEYSLYRVKFYIWFCINRGLKYVKDI